MLENGIPEENILMLTFTKKAAEEMKERLKKLLNREIIKVEALTFHSLCGKIISRNKTLFKAEKMKILDEEKNRALISFLVREYKREEKNFLSVERVAEVFKRIKNGKKNIESSLRKEEKQYIDKLKKIYFKYEKFKKDRNLFSFDDLIERVLKELKRDREFRDFLQSQYRYIVVDEYQDTNILQRELLKYLVGENGNLMAVGDDSQSIYGFRDADFESILKFNQIFPKSQLIKLEVNYRSTDEIIDYSRNILNNLFFKYRKDIKGTGKRGEKPYTLSFKNEEKQWEYICEKIEKFHREGVPYKEIAVLYRNSYTIQLLKKFLSERKIPYAMKINKRVGIEDIYIKLLELKNDCDDILNWEAVVSLVPESKEISVLDIIEGKENSSFVNRIKEWIRKDFSLEEDIQWCMETAEAIIEEKYLDNKKRERLRKFQLVKTGEDLERYIARIKNMCEEEREDKVVLISCHSSKGLEWDVVFIPNLLEGVFPNIDNEREEEKRIFYVACTRSRKFLYLLYPEYFAERKGYFNVKSSFIKSL